MPAPRAGSTLSAEAYDRLRAELLRGSFTPGSKLRIGEIARGFSVSASVLREAMTRLAQDGLLSASPQRGFSVPELTVGALEDLTRARRIIEAAALRESIADGSLSWESDVLAAHHMLERTPFTDGGGHITEEWGHVHRAFHEVILAGGRSETLAKVATDLRARSALFVHWSRELVVDESRDVPAEHREIAEATVARDVERAVDALECHIQRSADVLIASVTAKASA
ncbi:MULTISPECIES: GntR family transcriptional regulator [Brevibacterium]|jgi:DNA-binding GntR family transcriptional regulator|uniref:GntR family transcriptional regulator n=1 Tax=Brevibacterium casei TaxID=33889 RepID=A0A7T4A1I3_9MICO|nr:MULTISPECIES: GntR family transcriptional regulator [Brevibacterium]QQB15567.1 GntR family transcriptional regulator [Brevibacterium casei]